MEQMDRIVMQTTSADTDNNRSHQHKNSILSNLNAGTLLHTNTALCPSKH